MSTPQWYNERVREQLVRRISRVIAERVRDPRVPSLVTITDIKLAADTRNATVFASIYADESAAREALEALNHAAPFIQKVVAESLPIRHFPKLYFKLDHSIEYSDHINTLLDKVKDDLV